MGKVKCLKMDPITDKSGHQMVGMAVSVCLTPAPPAPAPVPIPYPTVGTVSEGVSDVCMRTKISGNKVVTVGSLMNKCHGNEPGTFKEVVSLNTAGPCFPALGAPLVISELGMMGITGSIGQMNKSISPGGGGSASGAGGNAGGGGGGGGGGGSPDGQSSQDPSNSGGDGGGGNSGADAPSPGDSSGPADQDTCQNGHPVDVVSGCVVDEQTDFALPGLIPLAFRRLYNSKRRNDLGATLGPGWAHNFEQRVYREQELLHLRDEEGRRVTFEYVRDGQSTFHRRERMWLHGESSGYRVERLQDRLTYHFERFTADDDAQPAMLTRIEDKRGNAIRFVYDDGRLVRVIDTVGRQIDIRWTSAGHFGRINEIRVSAGSRSFSLHYRYDSSEGCLTQVIDPCRHSEEYAYDKRNRMVAATIKNGVTFEYAYDDASNRCTRTSGPDGLYELTLEYDLEGRRTIARGDESRVYEWNDAGRMVRESTPSGIVLEHRAFDHDNYLIADVDGAGQGTRYWYDELGQVSRVVDAADNETKFEHAYGRPTKKLTPDGLETTYQCNRAGELVSVRRATGATFSLSRDDRGRVTAIDGPFGRLVAYEYDAWSNVAVEVDGCGRRTMFQYDPMGRPVSRTDAQGKVTRIQYDALGRRTSVSHPDGTVSGFAYDELNNVRQRTDRLGREWRYRHDGMGVLTELVEPSGARWKLTYTAFERLASITNPAGATYSFDYDEAGRVVTETTFEGRKQAYLYNAAGLVEEVQYDDGEARAFAYDVTRRMVEEGTTDNTRTVYQRDVVGRLLKAIVEDGDGKVEQVYERDAFGYVVAERQNGQTLRYQWDALGRRTVRELPDQQVTQYRYDNDDALSSLLHTLESHSGHRLEFERDQVGNVVSARASVARDTREAADPSVPRFAVNRQADDMGRLISQSVVSLSPSSDVRAAVTRSYVYDRGGRVCRIDDQRWGTTEIAYDPSDRLLSFVRGDHREAFAYDDAGSIEAALTSLPDGSERKDAWTHDAGSRVLATPDTAYAYDDRGRRVRKVETDPDDGTERVTVYDWDRRDRLRAVQLPDGTRTAYRYGPHGRRQRKEHFAANGELIEAVDFLWDGDVLCADRVEGEHWRVFVSHPVTRLALLQVERGEVFTCVSDQVGVVRELIDQAGHVAWSGNYSVWGTLLDSAADEASITVRSWKVTSPFRLLGQYHDAETGFACTRYRYFDASTASWCSADPIGISGGLNLFGFNRSPSLVVDLLGLSDGGPHGGGIIPEGTQDISDVDFQPAGDKDRVWLGHYGGNGMIIGDARMPIPLPGKQHLQGQERQFGGRNLSELPGTIEAMRPEIDRADEIMFNVPEGGIIPGTLTHQEHQHIQSDPALREKTTYYTGAVY